MENEGRIRRIRIDESKFLLRLSSDAFHHAKEKYGIGMTCKELRKYLAKLHTYHLNDFGLSVNLDGSSVEIKTARYLWASLGINYNNEPLYAWMHGNGKGEFRNIVFGTRKDFDKEIVSSHKTSAKASQSKNITDK